MKIPTIIEQVLISDLDPYANNARTHSADQVKQIAAAITEFGWSNPCLINENGGVLAGHGRILAASHLKMESVPCIRLSGLSEVQQRALILSDNKLALNASWDDEMLAAELKAISELDFDMSISGFASNEIDKLLKSFNQSDNDPDEVPEIPANPVSRIGDIWILGDHRIICGDSTNAETVTALLGDEQPHLMVTDPPYGIEYDADWRNHTGNKGITGRAVGKVLNDDNADWSEAWALFPGDVAYVYHAGNMAHIVADSLIKSGLHIRSQIIWAKSNMVIGRGDYHPKHEPLWYCVRKGKNGHYVGDRKQTTVWEIDKPQKSETGHSTQKPVECMLKPIENNSKRGDAVYEPFSGSGTTIIAGEMSGRRIFAIELSEKYVDIAVERWQNFTKSQGILEMTGESFAELKEKRHEQEGNPCSDRLDV